MFSFRIPFYASIRNSCKYYLRRRFGRAYERLSPHEDQISILASFLLISSSFMSRIKSEQYFDLKWQSYLRIYSLGALNIAVMCAVRYWLDVHPNLPDRAAIEGEMEGLRKNFTAQYNASMAEEHRKYRGDVVPADKQLLMLDLVLRVYRLYRDEIPKDPGKVLELVKHLSQWKEIALEVFRYKAEYVLFSFLVNLRR